MARRFEYDRLTAEDFCERLDRLDMALDTFGRITGASRATVQRWANGDADVPHIAALALELLQRHPANVKAARQLAAQMIRLDKDKPERGEYPFLKGGDDAD